MLTVPALHYIPVLTWHNYCKAFSSPHVNVCPQTLPTEIHQHCGSVYTSKLGKDNAQICYEMQAIYPVHLH